MQNPISLALIGSGATTVFLLKNILNHLDTLSENLKTLAVFEKYDSMGMGMPYNPKTTDIYNRSNISSEEIPELVESFADWLRAQEESVLQELQLTDVKISDSEVYNRLALGKYLQAQYNKLVKKIEARGVEIQQYADTTVTDLKDLGTGVELVAESGRTFLADRVITATGHYFYESDRPEHGYYASPWPIFKLLPPESGFYNFTVGLLGSSLSAFDVVSSLSHRHGIFKEKSDEYIFELYPEAEGFKIVLHDANGWLPHLQYEQKYPMREIYRHVNREDLLQLKDENGFLRLSVFFDEVCRPALEKAFNADRDGDMCTHLAGDDYKFSDFIEEMTERHTHEKPFEGMREELKPATDSVENDKPIHWKEVTDDLMYCLNYHAELLCAEDRLFFEQKIMPFLMNIIAAMPLPSAKMLLAMHASGHLELKAGKIDLENIKTEGGKTKITVTDADDNTEEIEYRMFVSCGGQQAVDWAHFPFPSLKKDGTVRRARAAFAQSEKAKTADLSPEDIIRKNGTTFYLSGGIDITPDYRVIGADGQPNDRILNAAFTHTMGVRPYSYGLQACNETARLLTEGLVQRAKTETETAVN